MTVPVTGLGPAAQQIGSSTQNSKRQQEPFHGAQARASPAEAADQPSHALGASQPQPWFYKEALKKHATQILKMHGNTSVFNNRNIEKCTHISNSTDPCPEVPRAAALARSIARKNRLRNKRRHVQNKINLAPLVEPSLIPWPRDLPKSNLLTLKITFGRFPR